MEKVDRISIFVICIIMLVGGIYVVGRFNPVTDEVTIVAKNLFTEKNTQQYTVKNTKGEKYNLTINVTTVWLKGKLKLKNNTQYKIKYYKYFWGRKAISIEEK